MCFQKLKSLSNVTPILRKLVGGVMLGLKDVRREEMSKFAALSRCTYNDEVCFVGI